VFKRVFNIKTDDNLDGTIELKFPKKYCQPFGSEGQEKCQNTKRVSSCTICCKAARELKFNTKKQKQGGLL
jgi:hypothetical protein